MADAPLVTAALAAVATHLAMAGEPAARAAQAAERALAGMAGPPCGPAWSKAVGVLIVTERYAIAARELERAAVVDALALRAGLHLRRGDLPRALADTRRLHALASVSGSSRAQGCAAALLAEVLLEIGATGEAAALFDEPPLDATESVL